MKVSVIVPCYNVEKWLPACLDSILNQTYSTLEIIAIDDGSTDQTGAIIDDYAARDSRIVPIHQKNGGVTSARLRGVQQAKGEWIGFVDGDDEIAPEMYERLLDNAVKYHADISHCGYQMVFPDGRVNYFYNTGLLAKQDKITALKELLSGTRIEPGLCNKLFHKNLLDTLFCDYAVPQDIKINEDLLMNFYLFSAAEQTVYEDWCPYHYIVRYSSASRGEFNHARLYDPIRVKDIIRQNALREIQDDAQCAYINTCINVYHSLIVIRKTFGCDGKRIRALLKKEKKVFSLLGSKRSIMARMIVYIPLVYIPVYWFYARFVQKDPYS